MVQDISRRQFLRGSSAAALTAASAGALSLSPSPAQAEVVTISLLLTALIASKQIYEIAVTDPQNRQNLRELGANMEQFAQQQDEILSELQGMQIYLRQELRDAFLNEDLRDLKTLAGQLTMYSEIGADEDTLDVAASHANMVVSRLGQYDSYAAFPALANACAIQMAFHKMRGASALEMREILRQQQRALGQWADFLPDAGIELHVDKVSDGFKVWRQYEYSADLNEGTRQLREDDIITTIDGQSTKDMSEETFQDLLKGPHGSLVNLGIKRGAAEFTARVEREFQPSDLDKDGNVPLKSLDQDIHDLYERLSPQISYLESMDERSFDVAEYIYRYYVGDDRYYRAEDISISLNLSNENAIRLEQHRRNMARDVCEPGKFQNNNCGDLRYRYTYNRRDKVLIYPEMANWAGARTGCLVNDHDEYEYWSEYQVDRYINGREQCLQSHFESKVEDHNRDLAKLRKLLDLKLSMMILADSALKLDLQIQYDIDTGMSPDAPYIQSLRSIATPRP